MRVRNRKWDLIWVIVMTEQRLPIIPIMQQVPVIVNNATFNSTQTYTANSPLRRYDVLVGIAWKGKIRRTGVGTTQIRATYKPEGGGFAMQTNTVNITSTDYRYYEEFNYSNAIAALAVIVANHKTDVAVDTVTFENIAASANTVGAAVLLTYIPYIIGGD